MLSDPENKEYILLETNEEAQAAFEVGYIEKYYDYYVSRTSYVPYLEGIVLPKIRTYLRVIRNEEKIKEMMKLLENK